MQLGKGWRWVGPNPDQQVLFVGADLDSRGRVIYTYSPSPGYLAALTTRPGPDMPDPGDPALVSAILEIGRRLHGRDD
jgi:hypothetical protein